MNFWHGLIIGFVAFPIIWLLVDRLSDYLPEGWFSDGFDRK